MARTSSSTASFNPCPRASVAYLSFLPGSWSINPEVSWRISGSSRKPIPITSLSWAKLWIPAGPSVSSIRFPSCSMAARAPSPLQLPTSSANFTLTSISSLASLWKSKSAAATGSRSLCRAWNGPSEQLLQVRNSSRREQFDDRARSLRKQKGVHPMRYKMFGILFLLFAAWTAPAAADTRFIVRNPSGLTSLQQLCATLGCSVSGSLDGGVGKLFLVTAPALVDPSAFLQILRGQPGITNAELDALLKVLQATGTAPPSGLSDATPVNYFGVSVSHGYVAQAASTIIRLPDTQSAFNVSGAGIVAVIDTGVDPTQPILHRPLRVAPDGEPIHCRRPRPIVWHQPLAAAIRRLWPRHHGCRHRPSRRAQGPNHVIEGLPRRWERLFVRCAPRHLLCHAKRRQRHQHELQRGNLLPGNGQRHQIRLSPPSDLRRVRRK